MDRLDRLDRLFLVSATGAALTVVALVLVVGPVFTAFIVAGSSFVLMIGMIALSGVQAFERWWRGHSWTLRRTKTH
jgi:hypothetical protein